MIDSADTTSRRELGEFIRSHRERLRPEDFGLVVGARRRTPGLKREEIAQLAGVSTTWYTWMEQGRDISMSATALSRLARVMRLNPAERAYLFDLAARRDPQATSEDTGSDLPSGVREAVEAIASPAYVLDRAWNAVAWNMPAERLFTGWLDGEADRNLLRFVFLDPAARQLIADWQVRAARLAAEFRADLSRNLAAPEPRALIEDLCRRDAFFAEAWEAHAVIDREGGERTFNHPAEGFLRYQQVTFNLARHAEIKLVILTPAG
jgi:transcriptional regulator with XRE-family HTH domain